MLLERVNSGQETPLIEKAGHTKNTKILCIDPLPVGAICYVQAQERHEYKNGIVWQLSIFFL